MAFGTENPWNRLFQLLRGEGIAPFPDGDIRTDHVLRAQFPPAYNADFGCLAIDLQLLTHITLQLHRLVILAVLVAGTDQTCRRTTLAGAAAGASLSRAMMLVIMVAVIGSLVRRHG